MALTNQLPIYKVAYNLLDSVTDSVRSMPRDFKQSLGGKIGTECIEIIELIFRANCARDKAPHIDELIRNLWLMDCLTSSSCRDYSALAAVGSAVGFGSPESRRTPPQAVFFTSVAW